jgi:hypothetical protein
MILVFKNMFKEQTTGDIIRTSIQQDTTYEDKWWWGESLPVLSKHILKCLQFIMLIFPTNVPQ